jgi:hypothetical protein
VLLIIGGSNDHNIHRLADAAKWRDHCFRLIFTDAQPQPRIDWQPCDNRLTIDGDVFLPAGTSLFIRYDVFSTPGKVADPQHARRNTAWFDAIKNWAETYPEIGILNRHNESELNKPRALVWAKEAGFPIPETWVTNGFERFDDRSAYIAKPIGGGDYTRLLSDLEITEYPWIVQRKLDYPELRLFRVGGHYFAFSIASEIIDYRLDSHFSMEEVPPPEELVQCMERLTNRMKLDYAAADFKTCPQTGRLLFLEINTMPMFTGYDDAAKGRLSDAIFLQLRDSEK